MDGAEFSIKQVADVFGNTRGAIRFYQEKGLVEPRVDEKGFRFYSIDDLFQLMYLKSFAAMSFSLDDVASDLRRESEAGVDDVVGMIAARMDDLKSSLARQRRQLAELQAFRDCLCDAQTGEIRFDDAEEYWGLGREEIESMMVSEPETLRAVLSLMPDAMVGSVYDLRRPGCPTAAGIRLRSSVARRAGIACSGRFSVLAAARVAVRTVRLEGGDLVLPLWDAVLRFAGDVRSLGHTPGDDVFSRLVFTHEECGAHVEYHTLFVRLDGGKIPPN